MKKAFKKLIAKKSKSRVAEELLQTSSDTKPTTTPVLPLPSVTAGADAICELLEGAQLTDQAAGNGTSLSLPASDDQESAPRPTSAAEFYHESGHSSRPSYNSQSGYSSSSRDDGDDQDILVEPLEGHPRYRKLRDLNRGTSGFVQLAENIETGEVVAIKFLDRGGSASQHVIARELLNHRECTLHPNIVQLKEVFLTPHHLGIALEYANGGDLSEFIDERSLRGIYGCSETKARWFFQQFIIGLDFCHRLNIANRDIKLDNVLLHGHGKRPIVKICDFGYSKDEVAGSICKTVCGTPEYMAPEVLTTGLYEGKKADIWSCGVMLYVLLEGSFPFVRNGDEAATGARALQIMFGRVMQADYIMPPQVSDECKDLLQRMLTTDPGIRMSIRGVMGHPWFGIDLPAGALQVNDRLQSMDNIRLGLCKQTAQEILDLVTECNALEVSDSHGEPTCSLDHTGGALEPAAPHA